MFYSIGRRESRRNHQLTYEVVCRHPLPLNDEVCFVSSDESEARPELRLLRQRARNRPSYFCPQLQTQVEVDEDEELILAEKAEIRGVGNVFN
jgi:hypothetical protein